MSSPTTPIAHTGRIPFVNGAWRPWSQVVHLTSLRQAVCGLLNKVTSSKLEHIAGRFVELVVRAERSGDPTVVKALCHLIVQRCVLDPSLITLVAKMVERAVDELEGEDLRWRDVYPLYRVAPASSFPSNMRSIIPFDLEVALAQDRASDAFALSSFAGELLVSHVLQWDDVPELVTWMFTETARNSDTHCVALCRMLRRIVFSTEASSLINSLSVVPLIEGVLEEDTISFKIRYMMMALHDQCLYPQPRDVFSSDIERSDIYGLRDEVELEDDIGDVSGTVHAKKDNKTSGHYLKDAQTFLSSRNLSGAEAAIVNIRSTQRYRLVRAMVSTALSGGDEADANFVATFLSLLAVRTILCAEGNLAKAFGPDIALLEDTAMDVPNAYHLMAVMLYGAGFLPDELEHIASRIVIKENKARDRLLEHISALSLRVAPDDESRLNAFIEEASDDEMPSLDYAYAY
ncbi:hypothetical protein GY45DRAFT_1298028 [Cubamyces sp. BRFM 1775]|nr:hypothetical protein GY45DRAFT_1298028 [Cubamyces sp. BRFM 1775]